MNGISLSGNYENLQQYGQDSEHIFQEGSELYDQVEKLRAVYDSKKQEVDQLEKQVKAIRAQQDDAVVIKMNGRSTLVVDKSNSHLYQFSLTMNFILVGAVVILWLSLNRDGGRFIYE